MQNQLQQVSKCLLAIIVLVADEAFISIRVTSKYAERLI
ncbi:hypothetical protein GNIT_3536 [Glaciecola nitratireducens FR1064]|uniref:Uncharacterized protein n=1 Tax=Glaciecola nitratireducens (strain JCM 12485 / KCTC 12276 / FR1064) TaxID=1085623 RepID=G4QNS2_GLANF|nr:hypothetical protein GNIT_3536 [Glaciecola nitratireducens FR1064]